MLNTLTQGNTRVIRTRCHVTYHSAKGASTSDLFKKSSTAITKCLKFYVRLSMSGPLHFAGKATSSSQKIVGKKLHHKHWSDSIHRFTLDRHESIYGDGCVINNVVCHRFDQWEQRPGCHLEWIRQSHFLCKVYQSRCWLLVQLFVGSRDYSRLGANLDTGGKPGTWWDGIQGKTCRSKA